MNETTKKMIPRTIDLLRTSEVFITWKMLNVLPYQSTGQRHLTYEGCLVFDYMKQLGLEYMSFNRTNIKGKMHGNTKGFLNRNLMSITNNDNRFQLMQNSV